jgi:hypothetical protein
MCYFSEKIKSNNKEKERFILKVLYVDDELGLLELAKIFLENINPR